MPKLKGKSKTSIKSADLFASVLTAERKIKAKPAATAARGGKPSRWAQLLAEMDRRSLVKRTGAAD